MLEWIRKNWPYFIPLYCFWYSWKVEPPNFNREPTLFSIAAILQAYYMINIVTGFDQWWYMTQVGTCMMSVVAFFLICRWIISDRES